MIKKIRTAEEIERKRRRDNRIIAVVFIILLLGSTAGFAVYYTQNQATGTELPDGEVFNGQYYVQVLGGQQFYFSNSKANLEDELATLQTDRTLNDYAARVLYIVSEDQQALDEIYINLNRYVARTQEACYGECESDLPEKTCDENLIVYTASDTNKIYSEGKCTFIEGNMEAVDTFLYKILGLA